RHNHSAAAGRHHFISVEAEHAGFAESSYMLSFVTDAYSFSGVFDHFQMITGGQFQNRIDPASQAQNMNRQNRGDFSSTLFIEANARSNFAFFFQEHSDFFDVDLPTVRSNIDKNRIRSGINGGIDRRGKSQIRNEDFVTGFHTDHHQSDMQTGR